MIPPEIAANVQAAAHELLLWVGFGTLTGLAGKAIMPGRDPGGTVGTLCMGIAGSVIGCGSLLLYDSSLRISPISGWGFVAATFGVLFLLIVYRVLSNSYVVEAVDGSARGPNGETILLTRRRRRRAA